MKINIRLTMLIAAAIGMVACNSNRELSLLVSNPLDQQRNDARILLSRSDISDWMEIPSVGIPVLSDGAGQAIACQVDDLNGDGRWDELFALLDLGPREERNVVIGFSDPADYPSTKIRTNLRLGANRPGYPELSKAARLAGVSYHNYSGRTGAEFQMEGPAWENDLVGFRNYLDQRNGMDIFGKTTHEMVLDSVGIMGRSSYHEPAHWGMDVLKVGTSLGAGAIAYMHQDSLYRVGDKGTGSYEAILEGPLRSRFNLAFEGWHMGGSTLNVDHQITIVAGTRCYESSVVYGGSEIAADLVSGIVNLKSDTLYVLELNESFTTLLTHDFQAEDSSLLSMAMIVPTDNMLSHGESRKKGEGIIETYFVVLSASAGRELPYRFYSLWEKEDQRWSSLEEVKTYLKAEADRWERPIIIK